ncbi:MAG: S41 family peptidase [Candidatus Cryptobacteroides sp.]
MKRILSAIIALSSVVSMTAFAQDSPLWLRKNSISPDGSRIVFGYKGNLYTVPSNGGKAFQLTSNPAYDSDPLWAPDGKTIVFSSYREGSKDIFSVDAEGGVPKRLTTHPGNETPMAVLEDGTVVFTAAIQQDASYGDFPGNAQVYSVGAGGGRPSLVTSLPVGSLSINADGMVLYEDIKGYEDPFRKHHTSSVTRDIWLCRPAKAGRLPVIDGNSEFTKLTTFKGEDRNPVFGKDGDTFYYTSEEDGTSNIYRSSISSPGSKVQLTFAKGNPVRYVSVAGDGTISFSLNGELYTMKEGEEPRKVSIAITADNYEKEKENMSFTSGATDLAVSPNGKEVAFIVRGNVFVTSTDNKATRQITFTPEQERGLSFSADGRSIYYASERDGNWGIWETSLSRKEDKYFTFSLYTEEKMVTKKGETCFQPMVSPDGKSIAYLKDRTAIAVMDIKSGKERIVLDGSVNYSYSDGDQYFTWSPDSRYILCNYQADGGWNNEDIALVDVESGEITDLTESGYSDGDCRWAMKGKAMTWTSDKAGYRSHGSWGAERDIYIMFFDGNAYADFMKDKEDRQISELLKDDKDRKEEKKDSVKAEKKSEKLTLQLADRKDRSIRLTPFSGSIGDHYLTEDGKTLYYMVRTSNTMDLCKLDIETRSFEVVSKGVYGRIYPSADGKHIYILSRNSISKMPASGGKIEDITFSGNYDYRPAGEREYIFSHVWKQVDEKFYDPAIHGIDWKAYRDNYERFLPHISNNFDFQEMLSEMLGELNGSHTGARYRHRSGLSFGTLGILTDYDYKGDGLKIKEILKGGVIYCSAPEVNVGDIVEAIDGVRIVAGMDWFPLLEQKAGKKVTLTIRGKGGKSEDITVQAGYSDHRQMYERWVRQRVEMVERLSGGKVGYVHVEGMNSESFRRVYSDLLGKYRTCEAVIVDTRHNGGGWLHDDLATLLSGKAYARYEPRGQYIGTDPYNKWYKPSCVLMGEDNYSDASGFPYVYKTLGIGKLIGAPVPGTMTAVWWETQIDPTLVFGIPQVGVIGIEDGRYLENMDIQPDILVYNDPASVLRGEDKQLEEAVRQMMAEIGAK